MMPQLNKPGWLVIGFYSWMTAVFFGANMLDIMYFRALDGRLDGSELGAVSAAVADGLLWMGGLMILAAFAAIFFSWKSSRSRGMLIASLVMGLFMFLVPMLLSQFGSHSPDPNIGAWLRMILCGSVTALAFMGLFNFRRQGFLES